MPVGWEIHCDDKYAENVLKKKCAYKYIITLIFPYIEETISIIKQYCIVRCSFLLVSLHVYSM